MPNVNPTTAWVNPALRLARRICYGLTPQEATLAKNLGANGYLEYQLNHLAIDDSGCENGVARYYSRMSLPSVTLSRLDGWESYNQLQDATLYRMIYSKRQLYTRLCEFWTDHFNVWIDKVGSDLLIPYHTNVIRRFGISTFPALLKAVAKSGAMMRYLDNADSNAQNPNQNYARELLELHTLGVDNGYTQTDVEEVARCFTGWSVEWDNRLNTYGQFVYWGWAHDDGAKTVLGVNIPAGGGITDGERVLDILANHPNTANFVCKKMIKFFLGIDPTPAQLTPVANMFRGTGGNIKAVVRAIFALGVNSTPAKFKRPSHMMASTVRALQPSVSIRGINNMKWWHLSSMGQLPFNWEPPNGYPDAMGYWAGGILERWNFGLNLGNNVIDGVRFDAVRIMNTVQPPPYTAATVALTMARMFCNGEMTPEDQTDLRTAFLSQGPIDEERLREAFSLAICSPSFQYF